jgi:hypothetical protein
VENQQVTLKDENGGMRVHAGFNPKSDGSPSLPLSRLEEARSILKSGDLSKIKDLLNDRKIQDLYWVRD